MDLMQLPIQQLLAARKQLDEELNFLAKSAGQIRLVQARFKASQEAVSTLKSTPDEKGMLVPLSNSLYVPGTHIETGKVVIDIGTGYLAEYAYDKADDYFKRRTTFIQKNIDDLNSTIMAKRQNYGVLNEIITERLVKQ